MLPGLFSISWARTAQHPGENFWIHACTHVADKQARVCTCILLMYVLYLVVISHLTRTCCAKRLGEGGVGNQGNKGTVLRENGKYSYRSFF